MNRLLSYLASALGALGILLGLLADVREPRGLVFGIAALAAFGTRPSLLFGALALVGGMATVPLVGPVGVAWMPLVGMVLAGLALGFLGRELDTHLALFRTDRLRPLLVALAAGALALTLVLPDPLVRLAAADGSPLSFDAILVDPSTALRILRPIPALVSHGGPLSDLELFALPLSLVIAMAALATWALGDGVDRVLRFATLATAALAGVVAVVALGELLFGSVALDAAALRRTLTFHGSATGPLLDLSTPPEAALALWSRPWVDGLRLVAALLLAGAVLWPRVTTTATELLERGAPEPWLPLALAAAVVALPFFAPPMALAGGVALGLGALVAGRRADPSAMAPRLALTLILVVWIWGAIATTPVS
ncbi:MAG: hypothetical protein U1F43_08510 [Myxococcota bacterium]